MKRDRLNPEVTERNLRRILGLVVEVRRGWEEAVDVGVYSSRGELATIGRGFSEKRPTEAIATAPTRRQARAAAREASRLIEEASRSLEEASNVLHSGLLRTDPDVLAEFLEKRAAALDNRTTRL